MGNLNDILVCSACDAVLLAEDEIICLPCSGRALAHISHLKKTLTNWLDDLVCRRCGQEAYPQPPAKPQCPVCKETLSQGTEIGVKVFWPCLEFSDIDEERLKELNKFNYHNSLMLIRN